VEDKALAEASLNSPHSRAPRCLFSTQRRLAVCPADCLVWIKSQSCGWLEARAGSVRPAHECHCGCMVDARGVHSFVCKKTHGRTARHHALNDMIARGFASAGFPVRKEPTGLFRTDGKRPRGLTLVPWQSGKACRLTQNGSGADVPTPRTSYCVYHKICGGMVTTIYNSPCG